MLAEKLEIPIDFIQDSLSKIELPERRQKETIINGFETIDDSYNISFTTARSGIKYAKIKSNKSKKKLLVITAGIPELGQENKTANYEIGKILGDRANYVIGLDSILISDVEKGLKARGYKENHFLKASGASDAWEKIKKNFNSKDTLVLMQPELTDLYY